MFGIGDKVLKLLTNQQGTVIGIQFFTRGPMCIVEFKIGRTWCLPKEL